MVFLIQTYLNKAAFAACEDKEAIYAGEIARARESRASGKMLGFFRRADCNGSVIIGDFDSHEALNAALQSLPMFKYWSHVEVLALVGHPLYPEFANGAPLTETPSAKSLMPEGF